MYHLLRVPLVGAMRAGTMTRVDTVAKREDATQCLTPLRYAFPLSHVVFTYSSYDMIASMKK